MTVEKVLTIDDLTMRNLKTIDLPKMMRIVKKLNLKDFLEQTIEEFYNEDVPEDVQESLKDKSDEEKEKIIENFKGEKYLKIVTQLLDKLIENYDKIHTDLEDFVGGVYGLKVKEVRDLDLTVFMEAVYKLKEQEQLINFFKSALK